MTNAEGIPNDEVRRGPSTANAFRHLCFVINSSFVVRVSSFCSGCVGEKNSRRKGLVISASLKTVPRHIAIIMDGNGRWAKSRGLQRIKGHEAGAQAVRECVEGCHP